jgi:hypothetical protein
MEPLTSEVAEELVDPGRGPPAMMERGLEFAQLEVNLSALRARISGRGHRIFIMHRVDGLPVPAIAAQLGLAHECVRMRLRRASREFQVIARRAGMGWMGPGRRPRPGQREREIDR